METRRYKWLDAEASSPTAITTGTVTQFNLDMPEGVGVCLTLYMGVGGPAVQRFDADAPFHHQSLPHLGLTGLAYTLARQPGTSGPIRVGITWREALNP